MKEIEKLKAYTVTKPSSDGTFQPGDIIWLSENSDLNNANAGGWLSESEWNQPGTNDFEVTICKTHYLENVRGRESIRKLQRSEDVFPGEWVGTEHELEKQRFLNIGDKAKVITDSQFDDSKVRRFRCTGTVVEITSGDEWAYKLNFGDGSNWFKRYHLEKVENTKSR